MRRIGLLSKSLVTLTLVFAVVATALWGIGIQGKSEVKAARIDSLTESSFGAAATGIIIVEDADSIWQMGTITPPTGLIDAARHVPPRVITQYANSINHRDLESLPSGLTNVASNVGPRMLVEYANSIWQHGLEEPFLVNNPPQLSSPSVQPPSGTPSTEFYYYVNYYDTDGDGPSGGQVYIDGIPYAMSLYSGTASNGVYRYGPKNLTVGSHNYYFYFADGKGGITRLPTSGSYSGPPVNAAVSCSFEGWVTLNGVPCPGSTVEAMVDTTVVGTATVTAGSEYFMVVVQDPDTGVPAEDDTVYFYLDFYLAGTDTWEPGRAKTLNLAAGTCEGLVSIEPSSQTVPPGGSFNVNVVIDSWLHDVKACHVEVSYDSSAFTAETVTEAGLLGTDILVEPGSGVSNGVVTYGVTRLAGNEPVPVWGIFITISFTVSETAAFDYTLDVHDVTLMANGYNIPEVVEYDGEVTVLSDEDNPDVATGFASLEDELVMAYGFKAEEGVGGWTVYNPEWAVVHPDWNSLITLYVGRGYWTNVKAGCDLAYGANTYELDEGWNLIGWCGAAAVGPPSDEDNPPAATGLASIQDELVMVYGYKAGGGVGGWTVYNPEWAVAHPDRNSLTTLYMGRGYWINVSEGCDLTYGANTYELYEGWNLIGWLGW